MQILVILIMKNIWQVLETEDVRSGNTKDTAYENAYQKFINRKNYGILSMLIPRARRARSRYLKSLEDNQINEKLVEIKELKEKINSIEQDLQELKTLLVKKKKKK